MEEVNIKSPLRKNTINIERGLSEFEKIAKCVDFISQTCQDEFWTEQSETEFMDWALVIKQLNKEDEALHQLCSIVGPYAEQPRLLDCHLEFMVNRPFSKLLEHLDFLFRTCTQTEEIIEKKKNETDSLDILPIYFDFKVCSTKESKKQYMNTLRMIQDLNLLCSFLYTLSIVCKAQTVCQFFPTDVYYLEFVLSMLEQIVEGSCITFETSEFLRYPIFFLFGTRHIIDPRENVNHADVSWKLVYILLQWMSLLILMPLDVERFGTVKRHYSTENQMKDVCVIGRVYFIVQKCLKHATLALQKSASLLLAKTFSRLDIGKTKYIQQFMDDCNIFFDHQFQQGTNRSWVEEDYLSFLCSVKTTIKTSGKCFPQSFLCRLVECIIRLEEEGFLVTMESLGCKHYTNILGYALHSCIRLKPGNWRYQQIKKRLFGVVFEEKVLGESLNVLQEEFYTPCERGVDFLMKQLEHTKLVVRWAAAKRLGGIVYCLPETLAIDIVHSVVALIQFADSRDLSVANESTCCMRHEFASHGAFLALAELIRKGCVLPNMLNDLIEPLCEALVYEPTLTASRLDIAIRDAACYVCWALARTYSINHLKLCEGKILHSLVCVALFDKVVNCRRAAAAALQEMIGRHGAFNEDVLLASRINFYSVSTRRSSYLTVAPSVCCLKDYRLIFLEFLVYKKLLCSDLAIREITYQALCRIAYETEKDKLIPWLDTLESIALSEKTSILHSMRHGSLLGLSSILIALQMQQEKSQCHLWSLPESSILNLRNIVPRLEMKKAYRGRGGDLIRQSVCYYIQSISNAYLIIPFNPKLTVTRYFKTLVECLRHLTHAVQLSAVEGLYTLVKRCSNEEAEGFLLQILDQVDNRTAHIMSRQGFLLAVGAMAQRCCMYPELLLRCLKKLCENANNNSKPSLNSLHDASTRQAALVSIPFVLRGYIEDTQCQTAEKTWEQLISVPWNLVLHTLQCTSVDYHVDNRGDVGSWVRQVTCEVAVNMLECFLKFYHCRSSISPQYKSFYQNVTSFFIHLLLHQISDKSNALRSRSMYLLSRYLLNYSFNATHWIANNPSPSCQFLYPLMSPKKIYRRVYCLEPYELLNTEDTIKVETFSNYVLLHFDDLKSINNSEFNFIPHFDFLLALLCTILDTRQKFDPKCQSSSSAMSSLSELKLQEIESHLYIPNTDNFFGDNQPKTIGKSLHHYCYDYIAQTKFTKGTVTIKLEEYHNTLYIFKNILPLLSLTCYRLPILEGLTNCLGISVASDSRDMQHEFCHFIKISSNCAFNAYETRRVCKRIDVKWMVHTLISALFRKVPPLIKKYLVKKDHPLQVNKSLPLDPTRISSKSASQIDTICSKSSVHADIACSKSLPQNYTIDSSDLPQGDSVHCPENAGRTKLFFWEPEFEHFNTFTNVPWTHLLQTFTLLLKSNDTILQLKDSKRVIPLCHSILNHSTELCCIRASITICALYASKGFSDVIIIRDCFKACLMTLVHPYPVVREFGCKELYTHLLLCNTKELVPKLQIKPECDIELFLQSLCSVQWWSFETDCFEFSQTPSELVGIPWSDFLTHYTHVISSDHNSSKKELYESFHNLISMLFTLQ